MAKGADFPRRPQGADPPQRREKEPGDLKPPEELLADAGMRKREVELTAELEQAREEEAAYEDRYGVTFDEFQAAFDPRTGDDIGEDYLAWSRAAERVRMARYELERQAHRRPHRPRRGTRRDDAEEPDQRGRVT
jgi:hypothetical protein